MWMMLAGRRMSQGGTATGYRAVRWGVQARPFRTTNAFIWRVPPILILYWVLPRAIVWEWRKLAN
eukprot:3973958-Pleurochrysis_carterae.AAC.2